ncbi:hypothetical protein EST38_g13192 [Candolleomyces aberdarensis]|uniref:G domain-containing protein n=1 Tax=Candolleomyces aberdarensis TaxID=2316362 RepID=A0A4Q2D1N3_9AGAR|nr:hypothetical protein EST38_g13192 [Candolleomyces aberdarensis]
MECFEDLISKDQGRSPLSITLTKDKSLSNIGLTYLDEHGRIGFEMLNPKEQGQKIRHTINPTAEDLHMALEHLCHYYYHRDRVNPNPASIRIGEDQVPFSSKFTIDIFKLEEDCDKDGEEIYVPSGPNLNIQGTGVELTLEQYNDEEDMYAFRITNDTGFDLFPYLFYFDNSNFSITPVYQPEAVSSSALRARGSLMGGYGHHGGVPLHLAFLNDNLRFEEGCLRLYVSTHHVDLSFLEQGAISGSDWKEKAWDSPSEPRNREWSKLNDFWDVITVPVVIRRPPSRIIGIIGSRGNGKNAFLKEWSMSLHDNTTIKPCIRNAFTQEYDIELPESDGDWLALVDLPAFEDNSIDNHASVLKAMTEYFGKLHNNGVPFGPLIWCYNISKHNFTAIDALNLNLIKDIVGPDGFNNVVVLTTYWNKGDAAIDELGASAGNMESIASSLRRYEKRESQLKPLLDGQAEFWRFGELANSAARERILGGAPAGDPMKLVESLSSRVGAQTREADRTWKLAETALREKFRTRLGAAINDKVQEARELGLELDEMEEDDSDRVTVREEKVRAEEDAVRWRKMLEEEFGSGLSYSEYLED